MAHRIGHGARGVTVAAPARLVLDTHVWLDLVVFRDPAVAPLREALSGGAATALVAPGLQAELERVLGYPALGLDEAQRAATLRAVAGLSEPAPHPQPRIAAPRCRDPDDQMFIDLALAARVDALLSRDDAVLRLAPRMRREGIEVLTPAAWSARLRDQISNR